MEGAEHVAAGRFTVADISIGYALMLLKITELFDQRPLRCKPTMAVRGAAGVPAGEGGAEGRCRREGRAAASADGRRRKHGLKTERATNEREETMTPDIGLANWFAQRAPRTPERKALRFEGRDWTYAQMQQAIEDCAARLAALGVGEGRSSRLSRLQPADVLLRHVRLGAARRDLRAAQFPPHRSGTRLHDRGLRRQGPDRRCAARAGDRAAARATSPRSRRSCPPRTRRTGPRPAARRPSRSGRSRTTSR